jgi:hypothetical protein
MGNRASHRSKIGRRLGAMGQERHFGRPEPMSVLPLFATAIATAERSNRANSDILHRGRTGAFASSNSELCEVNSHAARAPASPSTTSSISCNPLNRGDPAI